jgi:hypothetical protein
MFIQLAVLVASLSLVKAETNDSINTKPEQKVFKLESNKEESTFDKIFKYIIDGLGPLLTLLGIVLTYKLLREKLIENHITNSLNKIQETNREVQKQSQQLIDYYLPFTYSDKEIGKEDIELALQEVKKIYYLSQEGSSDVVSLLFYLKSTVQKVIKNYNSETVQTIYSTQFYSLIIWVLDSVISFCSQVVQIPKSTKIQSANLLNNRELRKYITHSDVVKYKHFNQKIIKDPKSAHYVLFYEFIKRCYNSTIQRAAFQTFNNIASIIRLLFIEKIYAPPQLSTFDKLDNLNVFLISFSIRKPIIKGFEPKKQIVELIYSNPNDDFHFVNNLNYESIQNDYQDGFIVDSGFDLKKMNNVYKISLETFVLEFDLQYLKKQFDENQRKIKRRMKNS